MNKKIRAIYVGKPGDNVDINYGQTGDINKSDLGSKAIYIEFYPDDKKKSRLIKTHNIYIPQD